MAPAAIAASALRLFKGRPLNARGPYVLRPAGAIERPNPCLASD
jgi:hypothetical protein